MELRVVHPTLTVAAVLAVLAAAAPAAQAAGARKCNASVHDRSSGLAAVSTVIDVLHMRCASARRIVHRYGRAVKGRVQFKRGGRFRLGAYRCTVYFVLEEERRARCVSGGRAFRVDYGS
jgi:hypothetical protein